MTPEEQKNHCYLGDGVYVQLTLDTVILRTGSHRDTECENVICLENKVLKKLLDFIDKEPTK